MRAPSALSLFDCAMIHQDHPHPPSRPIAIPVYGVLVNRTATVRAVSRRVMLPQRRRARQRSARSADQTCVSYPSTPVHTQAGQPRHAREPAHGLHAH